MSDARDRPAPAPTAAPAVLHDFFAAAAARWPHHIAIDVPPGPRRPARQRWTYGELAAAAAAIRSALAGTVAGECTVAILLPRGTPWPYAAQLGVLQAGAAYVCLDGSQPDAVLLHVLRDSAAVAVLTDADGERRLRAATAPLPRLLSVPLPTPVEAPAAALPPPTWLGPASLAYVIYTSGSTGKPKGVLLLHRGIVNLVTADLATFGLRPGDRIAQGSSLAYDSSVEETWLALAAGATVVVADDDTVRLGPDLVGWLRDERIAVFCPPPTQLRAMACADPARDLPDLRLLYVGGEALSQDLADHWADACWLENGYGPTECTVTVVRGRVHRGRPVTIGQPVAGHRAFVLDEQLEPVPPGTPGELCLAGPGLARGYLHQPELTAQRFPEHPRFGRLYRTGDLVQQDRNGELLCLGRIDTQIKLRGHRIELEAIEAVLSTCPGVRQAACRLAGQGPTATLVACVVPADPAAPPDVGALRVELSTRLPAVMVPGRFVFVDALPTTIGGKLDRRALPEPPVAAGRSPAAAPRDELQALLVRGLDGLLPDASAIGPDDDFFAVGGDSLRAAQWISILRSDPRTAPLAVRDVYEARTVAGLAALARARAAATPRSLPESTPGPAPDVLRRSVFGLVLAGQVLWLAGLLGLGSAVFVLLAQVLPQLLEGLGPTLACLLLPLLSLLGLAAYGALAVGLAVATKRALLGVCRPGAVPVGSGAFLRHWLVQQAVRLVPWQLLQGTELQCTVLRWLGARIGRRVVIHRGVDLQRGGWDLLELGDDAVLGQDAALLLAELRAGHLVLAPVSIGARSTVDVRACVSGGASLGDEAFLTASSWLAPGERIGDGERWDGIPASPAGTAPPAAVPDAGHRTLSPTAHTLAACLLRSVLALAQTLPTTLGAAAVLAATGADGATVTKWLLAPWSMALWAVLAFAAASLPLSLLWQALLARWLAPAVPGHFPLHSIAALRIHACTGLVHAAGEWLSGTLFWPGWLRLAGMRVGARCEISTILDPVPRHVEIGGDTFFADGIYLAGPRRHRGVLSLLPTRIGRNTFLGNHAVVPAGQQLPDDLLLGVSTVADAERMPRGTDWFGHPPFPLPRREVVHADRRLTHEPGLLRRLNRGCWEVLRWFLPWVPLVLGLWWYDVVAAASGGPLWRTIGTASGATLLAAFASCAFVLATKWLLLGRVRPGHHALWSCWCSRWDFLYVAWHRLARPLLANLEGTLLLPWYLRAMGAEIGRRTVLGPGFAQLVDPDMIHIGDGATVDAQFQAHSFEDRVLKIDHLHIRAGASIGHGTVLLYGADIGECADVAPQAVVMKQERLAGGRRYEGFPVRVAIGRPHG